ncbi:hypothetical protein LguiB_014516 [Lonicera macranthoides]
MFLAVEVENGDTIVNNRFLGFLIWESIHSIAMFLLCKSLLLSPFTRSPLTPSLLSFATFIAFHPSLFFFFITIAIVASPHPDRGSLPWELSLGGTPGAKIRSETLAEINVITDASGEGLKIRRYQRE